MTFLDQLQREAEARPQAPAVFEHGRLALTYGELTRRASRLAAALVARGAGRDIVVGLDLGKSADYVVAMVATWWAGAAFLPLDPDLPEVRLRFMQEEAGVHLRISDVVPDADSIDPVPTDAESLAYVIFTSGTTTAKGVMVPHRGIMNLLMAQVEAFGLGRDSRVLWVLSPAFDASVSDVGTALAAGAALCIEPPRELLTRLLPLMGELGITHADLPPSLLPRLDVDAVPPGLQTVVIGGEVCPPEVVRRWATRVRLVNVYGPTEATVCASLIRCDEAWERPLLGRTLPGVDFRVEEDELLIGGMGLFRGYVNRPDLTAASLVVRDGRTWYRTGDRVTVREDGSMEFVGRIDRQVKIRGMLVRPEEIEGHLQSHPGITRAAVVKTSDVLTAYLATDGDVSRADLRRYLEGLLPIWMIPSRWVFLDVLPATASGKVSLRELPLASAPETPTEVALARIWERLLDIESLSRTDSFFDLGGYSLAVLDMVVAAGREGLSISPEAVYESPTLAALAARLDAGELPGIDAAVLRADVAWTSEWEARLNAAALRKPAPGLVPRGVLVTGATGFLGRHLVAELSQRLGCPIYCLGRQAGTGVVLGDLAQPRLGMEEETWGRLAEEVDTVYHCGAMVHMLESYPTLRAVNVEGTREVVRFLCQGRPKRLHHASSLSVLVGTDCSGGPLREQDDLSDTGRIFGGYAQSKWAAEVLLRGTQGRGGPAAIYRLGLLTGPTSGKDWLTLFVRSLATLGCVPEYALGWSFDMTPVQYAAAALAHLSLHAGVGTFHIANSQPATLGDLAMALRAAGQRIDTVSSKEWQQRAGGTAASLLGGPGAWGLFSARGAVFEQAATQVGLQRSGLEAPPPGSALVGEMVRHSLALA